MIRKEMESLERWKNSENRKPLLIRGARQVGKTWLMKEFGQRAFKKYAYVNLESNSVLKNIFKEDYDIPRIIRAIEISTKITIDKDTLIIIDEIQAAEGAITSLKYFHENAPEYAVISAGSLLGVALSKNTSFPVGKVAFLDLYPLSFKEFLTAIGESPLVDLLESGDWELIKHFKKKYKDLLRTYYYVGGMPEVVFTFKNTGDFNQVRTIQSRILSSYEQDFSKHPPTDIVPRIRMLWNSIPSQLAKENKKFIYSAVRKGARAKDFELSIAWLIDCGLVHKISRVTKPGMPLKAYEDFNSFKLFIVDLGLLGAMVNMDPQTILMGNTIFEEFKGSMTEQFVLQELLTLKDISIFYWSSDSSTAEIDFIVQQSGQVIPIEVKAEENLKAKSLKVFCDKYKPKKAVRTSLSDYREEDWLTNLPLYAVSEINTTLIN